MESLILKVASERLTREAEAVLGVADTLGDSFVETAGRILACRGKLFIGGSGTSGIVARRMAHILSVTGTPSVAFSPMDSLHGGSGAVTENDLVLLISKGGRSDEVLDVARIVKHRGAGVIALTGRADAPLAQLSDHVVIVNVPAESEIGGVVATGITLAQSAWGDALAEVLMRGRGYSWGDFMTTHPAGAVGMRTDLPADFEPLAIPRPKKIGDQL